ncbi:MAG: hemerythrin domain-containing protein [Zoogloeaceae bacterium]|jgi:hemerythrin-like metal-binding protein|nr:hemerythrin domain-containing protein [Zoogloeaceae bacterium]
MEWKDRYALGIEAMDATHREFVDLVGALSTVADDAAISRLEALIAHSEAHFEQENRWMKESGFPPIHCHVGEHRRVIASLKSVLFLARRGNPGLARIVAREMATWFENHVATMDAALAAHLRPWFRERQTFPGSGKAQESQEAGAFARGPRRAGA